MTSVTRNIIRFQTEIFQKSGPVTMIGDGPRFELIAQAHLPSLRR